MNDIKDSIIRDDANWGDLVAVVERMGIADASRLIAAAPDLLAALRDAVEIIEGTGLDASIQRAVIAKFTGDSV